jgi:hypothetical protein
MNSVQVVLGLITLGALVYTVLAYPNKYGALSGRSRLFRTINICLLDLLLMLVLLATFIDWKAELNTPGASSTAVMIRFGFYVAACLFLCLALLCVAMLDALETYTVLRKERRITLERTLREQIEQARAEAAAARGNKTDPPDFNGPAGNA